MAAISCDICGGNLSMDSSGDFAVCESCGLKHTKDRLKTKALEITGTVAVSNLTHYKDIWEAAGKGIVQDVAYFIENGTDVNAKDSKGKTPLLCAFKDNSNLEVLKYLFSKGADVKAKDKDGYTPLHIAARKNFNVKVLKYLVSQGADVNAKEKYGNTPLQEVARNNPNVEVLKCLVSLGADVNAKDIENAKYTQHEHVLKKAMEEQIEERNRIYQKRVEEQKHKEEQERRIEQKRREEQAMSWREAGLCQYCGGQIGGVFTKKCKSCGKEN
jgi:hypothetical protein